MAEIFTFPSEREKKPAHHPLRRPKYRGSGVNIRTLCFCSRTVILESDDADLVRDVSLDLDKAQTKLQAIQRRLQGVQEYAAAQAQLLTAAETKLSAAIVAALLSRQR